MDICDMTDPRMEIEIDFKRKQAEQAVKDMPEGEAGYCYKCGEHFARLVGGACGRCRDKFGLK